MSQPIWIDLASTDDIGPAESVAADARRGTHVVLRFPPALDAISKAEVITRLAALLPEHRVFDSGGNRTSTWITVMPVVARHEIVERRAEIEQAIQDYQRTCASLVKSYRQGSLSQEWDANEHGGECRFKNARTGQIVEAPYEERAESGRVDPYFFAVFVRTTAGHERVGDLIKEDFHDAARILDVIEAPTAGDA